MSLLKWHLLNFIAHDYYPLAPSYRLSKIGVNGLACLFAKELNGTNILINNYSPGWMKTDIGGADAPVDCGRRCRNSSLSSNTT